MIRIVSVFIIIFIFFISCDSPFQKAYKNEPKYVRLADQIVIKTATKLKKERNLQLVGTGGSLMYCVEKLHMSLLYKKGMNLDKARNLIVYSSQLFLKNINDNTEIRPFLTHYPFNANDIRIFICIQSDNTFIKGIRLSKGKIIYSISDEKEVLKEVHEESYDKAFKIIKENNPNKIANNLN